MSPFRIQCETCHSWLKVRDAGFVGEVHGCPKCGSMVLITAPAGAELTAQEIVQPEPQPTEQLTLALSDSLEAMSEESLEVSALEDTPDTASVDLPGEAPEPEAPTAQAEPAAPAAPDAEPEPTQATPQRLPVATLVAGAGLAASAMVLGGVLWARQGEPESVAQAEPAPTTVQKPQIDEPSQEPEPSQDGLPPEEPSPIAEEVLAEATDNANAIDEEIEQAIAFEDPLAPADPGNETVSMESEPEVARVASIDPVTPRPELEPIDPLEVDPSRLELVLVRGGAEPSSSEAENEGWAEDFAPPEEETDTKQLDARLAAAAATPGVQVVRGKSGDPINHAPSAPAAEQLAVQLPLVDLTDVPLHAAIELLSQIAAAPITLNPAELRLTGTDPRRKVALRGEEARIDELLDQALTPARLTYQVEGAQVRVTLPDAEASRTVQHRVEDLAQGDPEGFVRLLERVGPIALEGHELTLEAGVLELTAPRRTQYELLVFCERLRVARGRMPQSKYPSRWLPDKPLLELIESRTARNTTFSFVTPTPLSEVFAHWSRTTDLTLLVDWRSLAEVDLGPQSQIECSATNRPWSEALDGVLGPLGLEWAPVDSQTLWITSQATSSATPMLEFYEIVESRADQIAQQIQSQHADAAAHYDPESDSLFVRGPAAAQRAAYDAWRAEEEGEPRSH